MNYEEEVEKRVNSELAAFPTRRLESSRENGLDVGPCNFFTHQGFNNQINPMKAKILLQISSVVIAMACTFTLLAQDASPTPNPAKPGGKPQFEHPGDRGLGGNLSPEDRDRLRAAHQKAMQDPKVQEAQKAFMEALKAAMLAADPTIGPLLDKMGGGRREHPEGGGPGGGPGARHHHGDSGTSPTPAPSASASPTR
jgi:hypothetical protein